MILGELPGLSGLWQGGGGWPQWSLRAVLLLPGDSSACIIKTHQFLQFVIPRAGSSSPSSFRHQKFPRIPDLEFKTPHESFPNHVVLLIAGHLCGRWHDGQGEAEKQAEVSGTFSAHSVVGAMTLLTHLLGNTRIPVGSLSLCREPIREGHGKVSFFR